MKYNIMVISDIHWGAIDPDEQIKALEFIYTAIDELYKLGIIIDLLVIAGDYFDSKLPLNSRDAIMAIQWFHELIDYSLSHDIQKVRMIQGTLDHDNDQLKVFSHLEKDINNDFFKLFMTTTVEETLPNLRCIYCPDETVATADYEFEHLNEILMEKDIGFFHGSFDVVYGELLASKPELMNKKNVIFKYSLWNKAIHGPMIAGHWHDGKQYDDLYYVGSPTRYKFNEDEKKGIGLITYDTEDKSYLYNKITNPMAPYYDTIDVYTNMYSTKEDYNNLVNKILSRIELLQDKDYLNNKLRVMIYVVDDKSENDIFISSLRQQLINYKNIKIVIKNKLKDKIKKESLEKNKQRQKTFNFVYDSSKDPSEVIKEFIDTTKEGIDIPLEFIKNKVNQFIH